jgi:hypothetical protein
MKTYQFYHENNLSHETYYTRINARKTDVREKEEKNEEKLQKIRF